MMKLLHLPLELLLLGEARLCCSWSENQQHQMLTPLLPRPEARAAGERAARGQKGGRLLDVAAAAPALDSPTPLSRRKRKKEKARV